jgi:hypothetical protein
MAERVIKSEADLERWILFLKKIKLPFTASALPGGRRSLPQNSTIWMWAGEMASQLGDRSAADVQADWKLRHGVPILRAESHEFRAFYDSALKPRTYEQKLAAMAFVPVTSIMTVPQMVQFMDAVQREALAQGIRLTGTN